MLDYREREGERMSDRIEFVNNYRDMSSDKGFQFEFQCNRCGTGYRTRFKPSVTGAVTGALDMANSLFGGFFGKAENISGRVHSAGWQKAHNDALVVAIAELKPDFEQCPKCQTWVCRKACWNDKRGLCKGCAPDLGVEMSAAQADKALEAVREKAQMSDEDKQVVGSDQKETVRATCPKCEAPLATNAKFCPNCGANLKVAEKCAKCGARLTPGAKFCPECGEKTA
jgi:DNA-directed RNA polymerase subunit M/transcription elongation factor TFIIS